MNVQTKRLVLVNPKHEQKIAVNVESLYTAVKSHAYNTYTSISEDKVKSFEFILFLCRSLETCALVQPTNPVYKVDKKKLIIRLLHELFPSKITPEHEELISQFIEYSHQNGHLVASSAIKAAKASCFEFLKKRA